MRRPLALALPLLTAILATAAPAATPERSASQARGAAGSERSASQPRGAAGSERSASQPRGAAGSERSASQAPGAAGSERSASQPRGAAGSERSASQARGAAAVRAPSIGGCPLFTADNPWNRRVDRLPVAPDSDRLIRSIGLDAPVHPDFGSGRWDGGPIGIPYTVVGTGQPRVPVSFRYASESDRGPYPIPRNAPIEGGRNADGDRHVIVVDRSRCRLYELFDAWPRRGGRAWRAGSGAVWDLRSNRLRPKGWTSADAAGLPILPGLARYEEVTAGAIRHALRFTAPRTRTAFVWPARHHAGSSSDRALPPMGLRVRLKRSVSLRGLPPQARVIAVALKRYGMMLADNGSPWYVSGAPHPRWDNDQLRALRRLRGRDFEVVRVRPPRG